MDEKDLGKGAGDMGSRPAEEGKKVVGGKLVDTPEEQQRIAERAIGGEGGSLIVPPSEEDEVVEPGAGDEEKE